MKTESGAERLQRATDLGYKAGRRGDPLEDNPYAGGLFEARLAEYWARGHAQGVGIEQVIKSGVIMTWPKMRERQAPQISAPDDERTA